MYVFEIERGALSIGLSLVAIGENVLRMILAVFQSVFMGSACYLLLLGLIKV